MNFVLALITIPTMFAAAIWRGYVFTVLWGWFVVTNFEGMPELGIVNAIGITIIVTMLTFNLSRGSESNNDEYLTIDEKRLRLFGSVLKMFAIPLMFLAFGWFWQMFV